MFGLSLPSPTVWRRVWTPARSDDAAKKNLSVFLLLIFEGLRF